MELSFLPLLRAPSLPLLPTSPLIALLAASITLPSRLSFLVLLAAGATRILLVLFAHRRQELR